MKGQTNSGDRKICTRKEPRYKASEEKQLQCETTLSVCGLLRGTVVDISKSGIRLLCEGQYEIGEPMFTELTTDRSHGIYQGLIRRVEPWKDGQCILGCSLDDPIPDEVLQELANEGFVNRRAEDRMTLEEKAKLSWQLQSEEVDVEVKDYSPGGMKLESTVDIPENVRLRVRFDREDGDNLVVEAQSMWYQNKGEEHVAGVAFTHADAPQKLVEFIRESEEPVNEPTEDKKNGSVMGPIYLTAAVALIGWIVMMTL